MFFADLLDRRLFPLSPKIDLTNCCPGRKYFIINLLPDINPCSP